MGRFVVPAPFLASVVLAPLSLATAGTPAQQAEYLPRLASGAAIGSFALTESDGGSDPAAMRTRAEPVNGGYSLNGSKTWVTSAPIADVIVVWAKSSAHKDAIRGFVFDVDSGKLNEVL